MKIPEIGGPGEVPQVKKAGPARRPEGPQAVARPQDSVEVGGDALLVSRLRAKLPEAAQPNPRVQELKEQVEQGTYNPDPAAVARKLMGL
ncbi:MAG TPA: flagellar biosynthesis anti-sigma factor FlgM [bacterium]|nr:flagellar biosynthesis anti-sigma factor FlgM [bacterium]